jgi:hypothetical protein
MHETYQGILHDDRIEWTGEKPQSLPADQGVRVQVTLLEKVTVPDRNHGQRMAAALEHLAASHSLDHISDPAAWQREAREDRPLPGRE